MYSGVLIRDHWIASLGGTAQEALERGVKPQEVWWSLCEALDVPIPRRHGRGRLEPKSHQEKF